MERIVKICFWLSVFGIVIGSLVSVASGNDIRGVESNVIYTLQSILDNNVYLYQNPNKIPYAITQYMPVYYMLNDGLATIFGIESSEVFPIRFLSRLVSLLCLVIATATMYKILRDQINLSKQYSVLLIGLFLATTYPWFSLSRPDALVSVCFILSIWLLFRYLESDKIWYVWVIGFLGLLSFASKQTGILALAGIGTYLLFKKDWKAILTLGVGFFMAVLFLTTLMIWAKYDLTFLLENTIGGVNKFDWVHALKSPYRDFAIYYGVLVVVCSWTFWKEKEIVEGARKDSKFLFLKWMLIITGSFSLITALKKGSGLNYFNDFIFTFIIFIGYWLMKKSKREVTYLRLVNVFLMSITIQIVAVHVLFYSTKVVRGINSEHLRVNNIRLELNAFMDDVVGNNTFFSQDRQLSLQYHSTCVLPQFEIQSISMDKEASWYRQLKKDINQGMIKYLIVFYNNKKVLDMQIPETFQLMKSIGPYCIYQFNR